MHKSLKYISLLSIVLTCYVAVSGLRTKTSGVPSGGKQDTVDESQFPLADEAAPEPSTQAERTKKINKERKYKKYTDTVGPGVTVASVHYHWPPGFPTLPVAQSDAVVIGNVSSARAYLTSDKNAVYSEFAIHLSKVLKNDSRTPLSPGDSIVAARPGGRVRYTSGHVSRFSLTGHGMPRVMRQYVFFLTRDNQEEDDYHVVTGYELRNGRIFPLDTTTSSDTDFDAYINMDEAAFFNQLSTALAQSSPAGPQVK